MTVIKLGYYSGLEVGNKSGGRISGYRKNSGNVCGQNRRERIYPGGRAGAETPLYPGVDQGITRHHSAGRASKSDSRHDAESDGNTAGLRFSPTLHDQRFDLQRGSAGAYQQGSAGSHDCMPYDQINDFIFREGLPENLSNGKK